MSTSMAIKRADIKNINDDYDGTPTEGEIVEIEDGNVKREYKFTKGKWVFHGEQPIEGSDDEEVEIEAESDDDADTEVEVDADDEEEVEADADVDAETEVEADADAETEVEAEPEADADAEPEAAVVVEKKKRKSKKAAEVDAETDAEAVVVVEKKKRNSKKAVKGETESGEEKKKRKSKKNAVATEDVWVIFKKRIEDGDDLDECIDELKSAVVSKKKKADKTDKVKRKPSAYNNFVSKTMSELKITDTNLTAKERLSTAAKMWSDLSVEEKEEYKQ